MEPSAVSVLDTVACRMHASPAHCLIDQLLVKHPMVYQNPARRDLISDALTNREAIAAEGGAIAIWNAAGETGRIPKDTYMVRHPESETHIDWSSAACNAMDPALFDELLLDALTVLAQKEALYELDRVVGAESFYALPTKVITDSAITTLFADNMFRPVPDDIDVSFFADGFTLVVVPHDKVPFAKYEGRLRSEKGKTVNMLIAMDFDRKIGLVYGTAYCGAVKKLVFTVMNYLLPAERILPLHCSANEDGQGNVALFLGLSGTGKTTLSNHPSTLLIGDDEHGWSQSGVANFENGCYAKLMRLDRNKEPEIFDAVFSRRDVLEHGAIIENAMVYPNGSIDLNDDRLSENSRVSYPLSFLSRTKEGSVGTHPKTIIFLTADAHGVLPPLAKLTREQAKLWFLMGYTSKLAGTETGLTTPVSTFSRFFGGPFMPRNPMDYLRLLGEKLSEWGSDVYLVNTGWTGGPYGVGKRMDIDVTRRLVEAALSGELKVVTCNEDLRFHLLVPQSCPGVDPIILQPKNTWNDPQSYERVADQLAKEFAEAFEKNFGKCGIDPVVRSQCPGM